MKNQLIEGAARTLTSLSNEESVEASFVKQSTMGQSVAAMDIPREAVAKSEKKNAERKATDSLHKTVELDQFLASYLRTAL